MGYLIDANVLITAADVHYRPDFCPAFWDWLTRECKAGHVFSVERVCPEITSFNPYVMNWIKSNRKDFFLPLDASTSHLISQVSNYVNAMPAPMPNAEKDFFLSKADPILIACAKAHGHKIVTVESRILHAPNTKRIKIPNVCAHFKVPCISTSQMLSELGACFGLLPARIMDSEKSSQPDEENESDDEDW